MNLYSLPVYAETKGALAKLCAGVRTIGVIGRAKGIEGVFGCVLQTASGEVVEVRAEQHDLEYKFEVFPVAAKIVSTFANAEEIRPFPLPSPVEVLLLATEDWLDPGIPCDGALGQNPIMQCQGRPGEAPSGAVAACRYFGGMELRGSDGATLVVATLPFPFAIHVRGSLEPVRSIKRHTVASLPARPNPSIEGTSTSGLRPLAAARHVKR